MTQGRTAFPFLIAEVANCHGGSRQYLEELVERLIRTKIDAIKLQPIFVDELISNKHSMYAIFKSFEFEFEFWQSVSNRIRESGKKLAFDIFGTESLHVAKRCKSDIYKIHTPDFDNVNLIKEAIALSRPLLLSTGGATLDEIDKVVRLLSGASICLMTGIQSFPTPVDQSNLNKIKLLKNRYGLPVGFMDHTSANDPFCMVAPCLAVQKGALTVEKHVYLKDFETKYDWHSAIDPSEIDLLRALMDKTLIAQGEINYVITDLEAEYARKNRKSAVATMDIKKNISITLEMVKYLRAESSHDSHNIIFSSGMDKYFNKAINTNILAGEAFTEEMFR